MASIRGHDGNGSMPPSTLGTARTRRGIGRGLRTVAALSPHAVLRALALRETEPVLLDQAVESGARDLEDAGRLPLVAAGPIQDLLDVSRFDRV